MKSPKKCTVLFEGGSPAFPGENVERFCESVFAALEISSFDISVLFCGNEYIRSLNKQFRGIDAPTDILSFGENTEKKQFVRGDIAISLEALRENSDYFKVSENEELHRLLVHGILHLCGFDHATNDFDNEPMLKLQEALLKKIICAACGAYAAGAA
jgi:probable rRNA maturation factor